MERHIWRTETSQQRPAPPGQRAASVSARKWRALDENSLAFLPATATSAFPPARPSRRRGTAGHGAFPTTISSISSAVLASRPGHCCSAPPSICRHPRLTPPSPCDMNSNTCFALPGHPRLAPPRLYPFLVCLTSRAHCQPSALSCELEPVGRSSVCLLHDLFAACDSGLPLLL